MNRDIGALLAPIVALAFFALILWQTMGALSASGAWAGAHKAPASMSADPFAALDRVIASTGDAPPAALRDPFSMAAAPAPVVTPGTSRPKPVAKPVEPEKPVLTAIVWDADPRALVRWQGREYTVHSGGLFDEFEVVSITRDHVTLKRGSESIVLQRKPQGD